MNWKEYSSFVFIISCTLGNSDAFRGKLKSLGERSIQRKISTPTTVIGKM